VNNPKSKQLLSIRACFLCPAEIVVWEIRGVGF